MSSSWSVQEIQGFLDSVFANSDSNLSESVTDAQISHLVFDFAFARTGYQAELEIFRSYLGRNEMIPEQVFHDALNKFNSLIERMLEQPSAGLIRFTMSSNGASLGELVKAERSFTRDGYLTPAALSALRRQQNQLRHNLRYVLLLATRMNWTDLVRQLKQSQEGRKFGDSGTLQSPSMNRFGVDSSRNRKRSKGLRAMAVLAFVVAIMFTLDKLLGISGG